MSTSTKKSGSVMSIGRSLGGSLLSLGKDEGKHLKRFAGKMSKQGKTPSRPSKHCAGAIEYFCSSKSVAGKKKEGEGRKIVSWTV